MYKNILKSMVILQCILIPNISNALEPAGVKQPVLNNQIKKIINSNFNRSPLNTNNNLCYTYYSSYKSCVSVVNSGDASLIAYFGDDDIGLYVFGGQSVAHVNADVVIAIQHTTVKVDGTNEVFFDGDLKNWQGLNCTTKKCNIVD